MSIGNVEGEFRLFHPDTPPGKDQEPISDEEIGNLSAAFGNHEGKLATLLAMEPGIIYDRTGLRQRVMEVQGEKPGWVMSKTGPFKYCKDSLAPIGLVTEEVIDPFMNTWGYVLTPYGERVGKPFAALLGEHAIEWRTPLYHYFGQTSSPSKLKTDQEIDHKKRAPLTRLRIYRALTGSTSPLRETDLFAGIMDVSQGATFKHLLRLKSFGIIVYESRSAVGDYSLYRLAPNHPQEAPPKSERQPTLTYDVWSFMLSNPGRYWSITEVVNCLQYDERYEEKYESRQERVLYYDVDNALSYLRRHGYLEVEKFDHLTQSQVSLTEEQRERLTALVSLLDAFQRRDEEIWIRGRELARSLIANPEKMALLFAQAKEASPDANRQSPEELASDLIYLVQESPGSTVAELQGLLEQESGRNRSRETTGVAMKSLHDRGLVRREGKTAFKYFINPKRK